MGTYYHTDLGALTILLQDDDVASLQVFHRESQTRFNMPPKKETFTSTSSMLERQVHGPTAPCTGQRHGESILSSFLLLSSVRRPIAQKGERLKYHPFSWREFLLSRIRNDYGDAGKENEIDDFKVCSDAGVENPSALNRATWNSCSETKKNRTKARLFAPSLAYDKYYIQS
jgi:hypothetical protein